MVETSCILCWSISICFWDWGKKRPTEGVLINFWSLGFNRPRNEGKALFRGVGVGRHGSLASQTRAPGRVVQRQDPQDSLREGSKQSNALHHHLGCPPLDNETRGLMPQQGGTRRIRILQCLFHSQSTLRYNMVWETPLCGASDVVLLPLQRISDLQCVRHPYMKQFDRGISSE